MRTKTLTTFTKSVVLLGTLFSTTLLNNNKTAFAYEYSTNLQTSNETASVKKDDKLQELKTQLITAQKEVETAKNNLTSSDKELIDSEEKVEALKLALEKAKAKVNKKIAQLKELGITEEDIEKKSLDIYEGLSTEKLVSKEDTTLKDLKANEYRLSVNLESATNKVKESKENSSSSKTTLDKEIKDVENIKASIKAEEEKVASRGTTNITGGVSAYVVPDGFAMEKYINTSNYTSATYPWGQCTWWVYNRAAEFGITFDKFMGNGGDWDNHASVYKVDNEPQVGDAVTFAPGQEWADGTYGHVAFVEEVKEDGTVLISESNVQGLGVISYRVFTPEVAKTLTYVTGIK